MSRAWARGAGLLSCALVASALFGCPKRSAEPSPAPAADAPQVGTLFDRWEDVDLELYAELRHAPPVGIALRKLALRHDIDRFNAVLTAWSSPRRVVVEIEDVSARDRATGSIGGWLLTEGPDDVAVPEGLSPEALLRGEPSRWMVGSVLLREWAESPRGEDPFDLLLAQSAKLPAPWSVCRPRTAEQVAAEDAEDAEPDTMPHVTDPTVLHAFDPDRGARVGLKALPRGDAAVEPGAGPFDWTLDHIELSSPRRGKAAVWADLGFADCVEIGKVVSEDRARRPKSPLGPPS